jgi:hypothetical protein
MPTRLNERSDVFIAHASEDKDSVARPLAQALTDRGWSVWLDELKLTVGDSLNGRIESALAGSRFGVVILSPAFFEKEWPKRELAGLAAREIHAGAKVILPVWHNVDHAYILQRSPVLADRLGTQTSSGIDQVAHELSLALQGARDLELKSVGLAEVPVSTRIRSAETAGEGVSRQPVQRPRKAPGGDSSRSPHTTRQGHSMTSADLSPAAPEAAGLFLVLAHIAPVGALVAQAQLRNPGEAAAIPIWIVGLACGLAAWAIARWLMGSRSDWLGGYLDTPIPYLIVGFLLWLVFGFALYS